jgi:hypothetical protein
LIVEALGRGRNAVAIWQDLVSQHGFLARYASIGRFVRQLRGTPTAEVHPVIVTPIGEEAPVDYGDGAMVRAPQTGKYRGARLFVLTRGENGFANGWPDGSSDATRLGGSTSSPTCFAGN